MTAPPPNPTEPREIELKLDVAAHDVERLLRHPLLRRLGRGRATTRPVHSVYFDTPELALRAKGVALRLRDAPHGRIQTVKQAAEARGGLFERRELETQVPGSEPDLVSVADPALRALLYAETLDRGRRLEPMVETEVRRTRRLLALPDVASSGEGAAGSTAPEIELSLDVGEIRTRRGVLPVCELELELLRGDPSVLFDVALALQETLDLQPASEDKAERGFAHLTGMAPAPRRARAPKLSEDGCVDDVLAAVLGDALAQISANRTPALAGDDPEGVHQLRVGLRRARSVLALFEALVPAAPSHALREELRWLAGELGPARDLDVLLEGLLEPLVRLRPDDGALKRLRDEAVTARSAAYAQAREALVSPRYARLALVLGRFCTAGGWREQPLSPASARLFAPAREEGARLLSRRHDRVLAGGRDLESKSAAELHALRIRLKKLRYASEFVGGLFPGRRTRRFIRRVARLQDVLGNLHDGTVAEELLAALLARLGPEATPDQHRAAGFAAGFAARRARTGLERLAKRWKRFEATEPFWPRA
jgi:triphosphatase